MATSFHEGFLSIVVPDFGAGVIAPVDCAVLEYRGGEFVELDRDEVAARIRLYSETIERVAPPVVGPPEKPKPWHAFARKLKSIAPRRR